MDASFWNERYVSKEYVYGKEPNTFFKDFIHQKLRIPGKLLLPAEGEGRNAVFAALNGYKVTAFDFSTDAKKKAQLLASEKNVSIEYLTSDISSFDFTPETFDVVGFLTPHGSQIATTVAILSPALPQGESYGTESFTSVFTKCVD